MVNSFLRPVHDCGQAEGWRSNPEMELALAGASARTTASAVEPVKEELCLCGDDWVARSSFPIRS